MDFIYWQSHISDLDRFDFLCVFRETEVESMRKELEAIRPEVQMFKAEVK